MPPKGFSIPSQNLGHYPFFRKPSVTCAVVDGNNKVKYNGDEYSLSALAKKLLFEQSGKDWKSARGADHFLYNGKKLSDMTLSSRLSR